MSGEHRILVTGARGFLGSHIVALARKQGIDVVGARRQAVGSDAVALDVCDAASVEAAFEAIAPSLVIHCATYGANYAEQDASHAFAVNVHGALLVLQAAARHRVTHLLCIGSCAEYGSQPGLISEDTLLNPTGIYGATKAAATLLLRERARALGVKLTIARPFGIWGPGDTAERLISQVVRSCLTRHPLSLTRCTMLRDYSYVEDMAESILALALMPDLESGAIVNLGSGKGVILRDFVLCIAQLLDGENLMHFGALEERPAETTSQIADTRRLRDTIGEMRKTPLVEGVRRMVDSFLQARLNSAEVPRTPK